MQQAAPTAATPKPARPRTGDRLVSGVVWANRNPVASTRKQTPVAGDMRPGSEVRVVIYPEPRSSSIPKLVWIRYSRREAAARLAVTAEATNVNLGLASTI